MKMNRFSSSMITAALAASVLFTGTVSTASAGDRDGQRRNNEQRQDQRHHQDQRHQNDRSYHQERSRNNGHHEIHRVHEPSRRIVHALPQGYRSIRHGDRHYYYHKGVYYNRYNNGYEIVAAPRFYQLPHHARQIVINRTVYFVCDNVYYHSCGDYYEVCETPVVERVVVCEPIPRRHSSSSIAIDAGPVRIVFSDHH